MKRQYTQEEDEALLRMRDEEGMSFFTIAKRRGESRNAVGGRYWRLKNPRPRRPKAAPKRFAVLALLPATITEIEAAGFHKAIPRRLCRDGFAKRVLIQRTQAHNKGLSTYLYISTATPIVSRILSPSE